MVLSEDTVPIRRRGTRAGRGVEAAEDGGGRAAFFDEVFSGAGDVGKGFEGLSAEVEGAEGKGVLSEGLEGGQMGLDRGGFGKGQELVRQEVLIARQGEEIEAEVDEAGEKVGFAA